MERHLTRSCVICRGREQRGELFRFVAVGAGLVFDPLQRLCGRGAYLHRREECLTKATDVRRWERALRMEDGIDRISMVEAIREARRWDSAK